MWCQICGYRDNPDDYQFCGNCGKQRVDASLPAPGYADAAQGKHAGLPGYTRTAAPLRVAEHIPAQAPPADLRSAGNGTTASEMTRYLCAAVTTDKKLADEVVEKILEEEHRAVAVTPGLDLVTVMKYALAARRRRLTRDVVLLILLGLMLVSVVTLIGIILFLPLLFLAWITVLVELSSSLYGPLARGLRPGKFHPGNAPAPAAGSFAAGQLDRLAHASQAGNLTLYSAYPPFLGYGRITSSWSMAIDVTKPNQDVRPRPFSVLDLYDHVSREVAGLDMPQLEISDRVFVNGREVGEDSRFVPDPQSGPAASVSPDMVRQLIAAPEVHARPYLTMTVTGWSGDVVVTSLLRLVLTETDLFVEFAHTVVPPLAPAFKVFDELGPDPTGSEFFGMAGVSLVTTIPRLLGSVRAVGHALGAGGRRDKNLRRVRQTGDYGALLSVREAAAGSSWDRYFQKVDNTHLARVIELRISRALSEFLRRHGVDTASLEQQAATVINNGITISGNATVVTGAMAGGPGAQAESGGLLSRLRSETSGAKGGEAS